MSENCKKIKNENENKMKRGTAKTFNLNFHKISCLK